MIILDDLTSAGRRGAGLTSVSVVVPSDRRIALFGSSTRDSALFIDILAGNILPTKGRVVRNARVSFPIGRLPGFDSRLTVRVNIAHVARLYGADVRQVVQIVEEAFGRSGALDRAYAELPQELRKPLSQVIAFALPFDTYLLTDQTQHPAANKRKGKIRGTNFSAVYDLLFEYRTRASGIIVPTSDPAFAREHCEMAVRLDEGRVELLEDLRQLDDRPVRRGRQHRLRERRLRRQAIT